MGPSPNHNIDMLSSRATSQWSFQNLEEKRLMSTAGRGTYISPYLLDENDQPRKELGDVRQLSHGFRACSIEPRKSSLKCAKRAYDLIDDTSISHSSNGFSRKRPNLGIKKATLADSDHRNKSFEPLVRKPRPDVPEKPPDSRQQIFRQIFHADSDDSNQGSRTTPPQSIESLSSPPARVRSREKARSRTVTPTLIQVNGPSNRTRPESYDDGSDNDASLTDSPGEVIDLRDSDNDDDDSEDDLKIIDVIDLEEKEKASPRSKRAVHVLLHEWREEREARYAGIRIRPGTCVEFDDGTFMRVHKLYHGEKNDYILVGQMYVRTEKFGPDMPLRRDRMEWKIGKNSNDIDTRLPQFYKGKQIVNEVVQKIRVGHGEREEDFGLWRRSIREVVNEREISFTNQAENGLNCCTTNEYQGRGELRRIRTIGRLTCRWIDTIWHDQQGRWKEQSITRPCIKTVNEDWFTTPESLQYAWRGDTPLLDDPKKIKFGDGFCGAGGMSCGAQQAGLKVDFSFDLDEKKISTHHANFPGCRSLAKGVAEIIERANGKKYRVHVLHLSPPCQPFSSANTNPNQMKNERNQTPLLACGDAIKALKPRIVTIEETQGIVQRHHIWFYALINQFTELGFSLRWTNIKCSEFGVPQLRKRFIIIAAAPGENLPLFLNRHIEQVKSRSRQSRIR